MTQALPLLAARDLAAPLAWRQGLPLSGAQFLAQATALAERLPARGRPVNLCQDRWRFALGLAAALLRGQTSLMPPNALPETLRLLRAGSSADAPTGQPDDAPAYALCDGDSDGKGGPGRGAPPDLGGLPLVTVDDTPGLPDQHEMPWIDADLQAVQLLTSGSTGAPQPHAKGWGGLVANIAAEAERLAQQLGRSDLSGITVVATVPAQHSYGFESSVLLALLGGAAFDAGRPFYPADIAAALAAVPAPRALVTTPFHLKTLLRAGLALSPCTLLLSATAPLSPQLAAQAEHALQGPLVEIYGCTEAGQVASRRTTEGETWTTLHGLRIAREVDPDAETGERFVVSGGHVSQPTPLADVLELQDATRFRLLGRANDLIHVAGKRSSLAHLNFHLNRIEGVEDGAFWLPHEDGEQVARPVAFVVAPTLSAAQVIAGLRERLEPVFVPRRVVFVDALPREATGKLPAQAWRDFAQRTLQAAPPASALPAVPASPCLHDDGSASADWLAEPEHPAFAGHFPGRPLLPGVVLLDWVLQTLAAVPALGARLVGTPRIDSVKFLRAVLPGDRVEVRLQPQGSGVAFELRCGDAAVARGTLSAAAADTAA